MNCVKTYIVDTHALVRFLEGNSQLSTKAFNILNDKSIKLVIPTIDLAEVVFLYSKKRIMVNLEEIYTHIANAENCIIYPLDEIVIEYLPTNLEIHDAIIVATALIFNNILNENTAVITKDMQIKSSGLINTTW